MRWTFCRRWSRCDPEQARLKARTGLLAPATCTWWRGESTAKRTAGKAGPWASGALGQAPGAAPRSDVAPPLPGSSVGTGGWPHSFLDQLVHRFHATGSGPAAPGRGEVVGMGPAGPAAHLVQPTHHLQRDRETQGRTEQARRRSVPLAPKERPGRRDTRSDPGTIALHRLASPLPVSIEGFGSVARWHAREVTERGPATTPWLRFGEVPGDRAAEIPPPRPEPDELSDHPWHLPPGHAASTAHLLAPGRHGWLRPRLSNDLVRLPGGQLGGSTPGPGFSCCRAPHRDPEVDWALAARNQVPAPPTERGASRGWGACSGEPTSTESRQPQDVRPSWSGPKHALKSQATGARPAPHHDAVRTIEGRRGHRAVATEKPGTCPRGLRSTTSPPHSIVYLNPWNRDRRAASRSFPTSNATGTSALRFRSQAGARAGTMQKR